MKKELQRKGALASRLREKRRVWGTLVLLGARMQQLTTSMSHARFEYQHHAKRHGAAVRLQRYWRRRQAALRHQQRQRALQKISAHLNNAIRAWLERAINAKATLVQTSVREVQNLTSLARLARDYRGKVVRSQRCVRAFAAVRNAQVTALWLQWMRWRYQRALTEAQKLRR